MSNCGCDPKTGEMCAVHEELATNAIEFRAMDRRGEFG